MSSTPTIIRHFPVLTPRLFHALSITHRLLRLLPSPFPPPIFLQETISTLNELLLSLSNFYSKSTSSMIRYSQADEHLLDCMIALAQDIEYIISLINQLAGFYQQVGVLSQEHMRYYKGGNRGYKQGVGKDPPAPAPPMVAVKQLSYTPDVRMRNLLYSLDLMSGKWFHIAREMFRFKTRNKDTDILVTNEIWKLDAKTEIPKEYSIIRRQEPKDGRDRNGWIVVEIPPGNWRRLAESPAFSSPKSSASTETDTIKPTPTSPFPSQHIPPTQSQLPNQTPNSFPSSKPKVY
ncbi:hypothetical protein BZA77DRAFT_368663 [Pyronema omphalodes]|nr:hypothetical protein BZA77DRAFT_368663 [Pyronema omphalodes]